MNFDPYLPLIHIHTISRLCTTVEELYSIINLKRLKRRREGGKTDRQRDRELACFTTTSPD